MSYRCISPTTVISCTFAPKLGIYNSTSYHKISESYYDIYSKILCTRNFFFFKCFADTSVIMTLVTLINLESVESHQEPLFIINNDFKTLKSQANELEGREILG